MIKCQVCGYDNPDSAMVCLNCGSVIERKPVGEAMDDISEEATILIGGPVKAQTPPPPPPPADPEPPKPQGSVPPPPPPPPPPAPSASAPTPSFSAPPPPPGGMPPPQPSSAPPTSPMVTSGGGGNANVLAIVGVSLGGVALIFSCCCALLSFPLGIAAIICGFLAMKDESQKTLGIIAIVLGGLSLLLSILLTILGVGAEVLGAMGGG